VSRYFNEYPFVFLDMNLKTLTLLQESNVASITSSNIYQWYFILDIEKKVMESVVNSINLVRLTLLD
jgi:hypothetical protein